MENQHNTAIVVAAGRSTRMDKAVNKQYIPLENKPILAYCIDKLNTNENIDEIIVVTASHEAQLCDKIVLSQIRAKKPIRIVSGADTRQQSVYEGLKHCSPATTTVLIHDGARPFVTDDMIDNCLSQMHTYQACSVGTPAINTIKVVDEDAIVAHTLRRDTLWEVQTPQCFDYKLLLSLHEEAAKEGLDDVTDDCTLAERAGYKVKIVKGNYSNIKITVAQDLVTAQSILKTIKRG